MTWIYAIPVWWMMILCIIVACGLACAALAFSRSRLMNNDRITHNDVASAILTTMGTLLAVIVAFLVIGVWQQWDQATQTVQEEAGAASDVAHLAMSLPQPWRYRLVAGVQNYLNIVITEEFPDMRTGGESLRAHHAAQRLQALVASFVPKTIAESNLQSKELDYTGKLLDARRLRILANVTGIPMILWAVVLFAGFLVVIFSFYFRVDRPLAQYVMVIMLTAIIASIYVLIAELDYPFRGDIGIQPNALQHVVQIIHDDTQTR
ncbi:MAG TPA: DUF4239 domain-containing protein [Candidatus Rubrimentiphilum sp.]|nr:DUF4239 domain-containing protein [Candidatus Rubrimentiphilum sp.]